MCAAAAGWMARRESRGIMGGIYTVYFVDMIVVAAC